MYVAEQFREALGMVLTALVNKFDQPQERVRALKKAFEHYKHQSQQAPLAYLDGFEHIVSMYEAAGGEPVSEERKLELCYAARYWSAEREA